MKKKHIFPKKSVAFNQFEWGGLCHHCGWSRWLTRVCKTWHLAYAARSVMEMDVFRYSTGFVRFFLYTRASLRLEVRRRRQLSQGALGMDGVQLLGNELIACFLSAGIRDSLSPKLAPVSKYDPPPPFSFSVHFLSSVQSRVTDLGFAKCTSVRLLGSLNKEGRCEDQDPPFWRWKSGHLERSGAIEGRNCFVINVQYYTSLILQNLTKPNLPLRELTWTILW